MRCHSKQYPNCKADPLRAVVCGSTQRDQPTSYRNYVFTSSEGLAKRHIPAPCRAWRKPRCVVDRLGRVSVCCRATLGQTAERLGHWSSYRRVRSGGSLLAVIWAVHHAAVACSTDLDLVRSGSSAVVLWKQADSQMNSDAMAVRKFARNQQCSHPGLVRRLCVLLYLCRCLPSKHTLFASDQIHGS